MPRSIQPSSSIQSTSALGDEQALVGDAIESANTLVVTHTASGKILSLHWPDAADCQNCDELAGQSIEMLFGPVAIAPYLERVQQVIERQQPEAFQCVVRCGHQPISFDFLLSPLPTDSLSVRSSDSSAEEASQPVVVGVGRRIGREVSQLSTVRLSSGSGRGSYYELLANVTSSIGLTH